MEQKNIVILVVAVFFYIYYTKKIKQSTFAKLEDQQPLISQVKQSDNVYHLDTRFDYPSLPPVNPNVYKSLLVSSLPADNGLYSTQGYDTDGYSLNQTNSSGSTNQLDYSGGSTQIIKIPLQTNHPFNEQLRSQEIMITPYNKVKYSKDC